MKIYQYQNLDKFGKYIIQLDDYFFIHVSGQRQTDLEKNTSTMSPGTMMVHVMHVLSVFFAVFENLKADNVSICPRHFH